MGNPGMSQGQAVLGYRSVVKHPGMSKDKKYCLGTWDIRDRWYCSYGKPSATILK